jgi:UDP-glucose 4-epimerase
VPGTSKIEDRLGWKPTRTLEHIIDDVIQHQRAGALV